MANTEGLAFMVFFVNGGIVVSIVLLLSRFRKIRTWWSKEQEGKTGYGFALVVLFFNWAILPMENVGDGIRFLDPESTYLTWWIYYWTDWGMRALFLIINSPPYVLMVVCGGIWPRHYLLNVGRSVTVIYWVFVMPVIYIVSFWWIALPTILS